MDHDIPLHWVEEDEGEAPSATAGTTRRTPIDLPWLLWTATMVLLWLLCARWHDAELARWHAATPGASFFAPVKTAWHWWVFVVMLAGANKLAPRVSSQSPPGVALLVGLTVLGLVIVQLATAPYYRIAAGALYLHRAEPWTPDVRLHLVEAVVLTRGCVRETRKHGYTAHPSVVVALGAETGGEAFDLGQGAAASDIASWLDAMPDAGWRAPIAPADERDDNCLSRLSRPLDPARAAKLLRLLT